MDIYSNMLTFCHHDTHHHENCRLWKNHHGNTVIGSTIMNGMEHFGGPLCWLYNNTTLFPLLSS